MTPKTPRAWKSIGVCGVCFPRCFARTFLLVVDAQSRVACLLPPVARVARSSPPSRARRVFVTAVAHASRARHAPRARPRRTRVTRHALVPAVAHALVPAVAHGYEHAPLQPHRYEHAPLA